MLAISPLSKIMGNLSKIYLKDYLDPSNYEKFSVKVGAKTGRNGVLSGVLSQADYGKFMNIVRNINVTDASRNEMKRVRMELFDAGLVNSVQVDSMFDGPYESGADGRAANGDAKYNQWQYQKEILPFYASPDCDSTRDAALNSFKLVAAVANASPITGVTVAKDIVPLKDRVGATDAVDNSLHVDLSDRAKRLERGENPDDPEFPEEMDIAELIKRLEKMEQAQRAAKAAKAAEKAKEAEAPGQPVTASK